MKARFRPKRSATLLPIKMNAADTNASRAIAPCTPLTVVSRSSTTEEIDTFIKAVSTTRTNMAIANRMARPMLSFPASGAAVLIHTSWGVDPPKARRMEPNLVRLGREVSPSFGGLEEFDRVTGRVVYKDLLPARPAPE